VELAIVLAVGLAIALRQSRRDALLLGVAGAVTLVGLVPWRLWAIVVDAPATYSAGAASDNLVSIEPSRIPIAALLLVRQLFDPRLWLVLVPVAICAFVVASAVSQRHRAPANRRRRSSLSSRSDSRQLSCSPPLRTSGERRTGFSSCQRWWAAARPSSGSPARAEQRRLRGRHSGGCSRRSSASTSSRRTTSPGTWERRRAAWWCRPHSLRQCSRRSCSPVQLQGMRVENPRDQRLATAARFSPSSNRLTRISANPACASSSRSVEGR
jgi:hypothetical protein